MAAVPSAAHRHAVLLVEDDSDTREAFILLARHADIDAITVENGRHALAVLRRGFRPCLVLLDLQMPDMDGIEFRREQMLDPSLADLRVIVLSADGWRREPEARALGLQAFAQKPMPFERVVQLINDCDGPESAVRR